MILQRFYNICEQALFSRRLACVVSFSTGCLLITAALLKAHNLYRDPFAIDPILPTRAWMIAALVSEFGVGVWLVTGVYARTARLIAAVLFGFFGTISLDRALNGEASCGCFGRVAVTPWLMSVLDFCLVLALATIQTPAIPPALHTRRFLLTIMVVVTAGIAAVWLLQDASADARLVVDPPIVQFGELKHGQRKTANIVLVNPGEVPVTVSSMRTSCPCLTVHLPEQTVQPHQSAQAILEYDSSREPNSTGRLLITAEGFDPSSRLLFRASAVIAVEKAKQKVPTPD